jgi:hypothetical protein
MSDDTKTCLGRGLIPMQSRRVHFQEAHWPGFDFTWHLSFNILPLAKFWCGILFIYCNQNKIFPLHVLPVNTNKRWMLWNPDHKEAVRCWEGYQTKTFVNVLIIFFGSTGLWTQGLALTRQVLYYLDHIASIFALVIFQIRSRGFAWSWPGPSSAYLCLLRSWDVRALLVEIGSP